MEFWDQSYYRAMKIVSKLAGQWPWQSLIERIMFRCILATFVGSSILAQINAAMIHKDDIDYVMEIVPFFVIGVTCFTKMLNSILHLKDIQTLLEKIQENWKIFTGNHELLILHRYSKLGQQWSILYLGTLYVGMFVCSTQPLVSQAWHIISHANGSLPHQFPIPSQYGSIDHEKYYYALILVSAYSTFCGCTMLVATDVVFYACCAHICGLFEALGYTLESSTVKAALGRNDASFLHFRRCIQIHINLLEFANTMENAFHWTFFVMLGSCTIALSMTAVQVVINVTAATRLLKQFVFASTQITQLFVKCWFAQHVMDHSVDFSVHIGNSEWYLKSLKAQKLMGLMIMRSRIPCKITAGKIATMSLDTFAAIVRVSVSYFTAFLALR